MQCGNHTREAKPPFGPAAPGHLSLSILLERAEETLCACESNVVYLSQAMAQRHAAGALSAAVTYQLHHR